MILVNVASPIAIIVYKNFTYLHFMNYKNVYIGMIMLNPFC